MVTKQTISAPFQQETMTIRFNLEGLREVERGEFELGGIPYLNIDFQAHATKLEEEGVDRELAMKAVYQMAEFVQTQSIASVIAKTLKRIG